jgi:trimethylguanosine synthase
MRFVELGETLFNLHLLANKVSKISLLSFRSEGRINNEGNDQRIVIAIDNSPIRLACARHNAEIYGVADRITFILADFITWSKEYAMNKSQGRIPVEDVVEVVFLSPPWGGIEYKSSSSFVKVNDSENNDDEKEVSIFSLAGLAPIHGNELFQLARSITSNVAYYLPKNVDIDQVAQLTQLFPRSNSDSLKGVEKVEIEEEWMGGKLKAVTAYFDELCAA